MNDPTKRQLVTWPRRVDKIIGGICAIIIIGFCFVAPELPDHVRLIFWGFTVAPVALLILIDAISWHLEPNKGV